MVNILPTHGRTLVLFAEWIRQELGGKTSLLGMYVDGIVVFLTEVALPATVPIGICYVFRDGSGIFDGSLGITSPTGQIILDLPVGAVTKQENISHTVIVQLPTFSVSELGEYEVKLILDGTIYPSTLTFRMQR